MKAKQKIVIVLLMALFLLTSLNVVSASKGRGLELRNVRVGYIDFAYYSQTDQNGKRSGIIYDYLNEIAKYAGWTLQFVPCDPQEGMDKLINGEVDIIGAMNKSDAMLELMDFSEIITGYSYSVLLVEGGNTKYIPMDYGTFDGMKIATYKNASTRNAALDYFLKSNNINAKLISYDNISDYRNAVKNGEADAILSVNTDMKADEKILVNFAPIPYYFGVTKGNHQIMRDLNNALEQINYLNPQFQNELYRKYFNTSSDFLLTSDEQQFINESQPIRVVFAPNWKPISYLQKKDNKFHGVAIDMLSEVGKLSGLKFEYVQTKDFKESIKAIEDGRADIIAGIYDTEFISTKGLKLSLPYLTSQTVIVKKGTTDLENLKKARLALTYGFDYSKHFPDCTVVYYDTVDECIEAVKNDKADYTAVSNIAVEQHLKEYGKGFLQTIPIIGDAHKLSIAYAQSLPSTLVSIIDKALFSISDSKKQSIVFENTVYENSAPAIRAFIYYYPLTAVSIIIIIFLLIVAIIFWIMSFKLKLSKRLALAGEAYRIIGEMADEYLFEYNFESRELKLPEVLAEKLNTKNLVTKDDNIEGIGKLFEVLNKRDLTQNSSIEFKCYLSNKKANWYRATSAILFDSQNKPIRCLGKIVNIQAEVEEREKLESKANKDSGTGLFNKKHCENLATKWIMMADSNSQIAVAIIDLDYFKQVNDAIGHLGGDEVIKKLSTTLIRECPKDSVIGRWGGDEFFIFIKNIEDEENLKSILSRIRGKMDSYTEYLGNRCKTSVSIGAAFGKVKGSSINDYLAIADEALYDVKRTTRNNFKIIEKENI